MQVQVQRNGSEPSAAEFYVLALGGESITLVLNQSGGRHPVETQIHLSAGQVDVLREILDTDAARRAMNEGALDLKATR